MKKIFLISVAIIAVVVPQLVFGYATIDNTIYVQNANPFEAQSLNQNIVNAIDRSTQALINANNNARTQQRLDALDQTCVREITNYIYNVRDEAVKGLNKEIADYIDKNITNGDMSNPTTATRVTDHLNNLYIARGRQVQNYTQYVINDCTGYVAPTKDQTCQNSFGANSIWSGKYNTEGKFTCSCAGGYEWNAGQTQCVAKPSCPEAIDSNGQCVTYTQSCRTRNNDDIYIFGIRGVGEEINCNCVSGYAWNGKQCIANVAPVAATPKAEPEIKKIASEIVRPAEKASNPVEKKSKTKIEAVSTNIKKSDPGHKNATTTVQANVHIAQETGVASVEKKGFWSTIARWFGF